MAKECLEKCVRGGSPLVILSEGGLLFVPYAGQYVKASGKLFERGGLHSISIEKIEPIIRLPNSKIPHPESANKK